MRKRRRWRVFRESSSTSSRRHFSASARTIPSSARWSLRGSLDHLFEDSISRLSIMQYIYWTNQLLRGFLWMVVFLSEVKRPEKFFTNLSPIFSKLVFFAREESRKRRSCQIRSSPEPKCLSLPAPKESLSLSRCKWKHAHNLTIYLIYMLLSLYHTIHGNKNTT